MKGRLIYPEIFYNKTPSQGNDHSVVHNQRINNRLQQLQNSSIVTWGFAVLKQRTLVTSWSTTLLLRGRQALSTLLVFSSAAAFFGFVCKARFLFGWMGAFRGRICRDANNVEARERVTRPGSSLTLVFTIFSFVFTIFSFLMFIKAWRSENQESNCKELMKPARNHDKWILIAS